MDILTTLILHIHEHQLPFHLFLSFSTSFISFCGFLKLQICLETGSHYVAQTGLELLTLLPLASCVLRLQGCTSMPQCPTFNSFFFFFFSFCGTGICQAGILLLETLLQPYIFYNKLLFLLNPCYLEFK
jgi:hypothetical protein